MTTLHVDPFGNANGLANASDSSLPTDVLAIEGSNQSSSSAGADISFTALETNSAFLTGKEEGIFTVGDSGWFYVDFLLDGGSYQGQLGFFSLKGMEQYSDDLDAFTAKAIDRVTGDDPRLGGIVIDDHQHGARFGGDFEEYETRNWDKGDPDEVKDFYLGAGTQFALVFMPEGTFDKSNAEPLFSIASVNTKTDIHFADITGDGMIFGVEDLWADQRWADQDYNDLVFALGGTTEKISLFEDVANLERDWRTSEVMQKVTDYRFNPVEFLPTDPISGAKYKPGEIILEIEPDIYITDIAAPWNPKDIVETGRLENFWTLKFEDDTELVEIRKSLQETDGVIAAGFNSLLIADGRGRKDSPDDEYYSQGKPNQGFYWGIEDTGTREAWKYQTGSRDVVVAILDTGIDVNHPDLQNNIYSGSHPRKSFIENQEPSESKDTSKEPSGPKYINNDHGYLVTGIIGAEGYNNKGVIGISPTVSLLPIEVLTPNLFGDLEKGTIDSFGWMRDIVNAIGYASEQIGADIINASFSTVYDGPSSGDIGSPAHVLKEAIRAANDSLFVTSSGQVISAPGEPAIPGVNIDISNGYFYPSKFDLDNILSVTATKKTNSGKEVLYEEANFGPETVHLAAPGSAYSTTHDNGYGPGNIHRTSYATAYVSGAAALLLAENPDLTAIELKAILRENADSIPDLEDKITAGQDGNGNPISGPRLNVLKALLDPHVSIQPRSSNDDQFPEKGISLTGEEYIEDTELNLADIRIDDPDNFVDDITLKLSKPVGNLTTSSVTNDAGVVIARSKIDSETEEWFIESFDEKKNQWFRGGELGDVNSILEDLSFKPIDNINQDFIHKNANQDFEIEVTITDNISDELTGTIQMTGIPVNDPPESINLSNQSVEENQFGAIVGNLSAKDVDSTNFTFELADESETRFEIINGNQLKLKDEQILDYELTPQINVAVKVTDEGQTAGKPDPKSYIQTLAITVEDKFDSMTLSNLSVPENEPGAIVGELTINPESDTSDFIFNINDSRFEIIDGQLSLRKGNALDFEHEPKVGIQITAVSITDPNETFAQPFTLEVEDRPDALTLSNTSITENSFGATIGNLNFESGTYDTITGVDDPRFEVDEDHQLKLKANEKADFETESRITVNVTALDSSSPEDVYTQPFTIEVKNLENAPIDLTSNYVNVLPESLKAGDSFDFDFSIDNTEDGDSGSFKVDFYLSKNDTITTSDEYLGSYNISRLTDNTTSSFLTSLKLPSKGNSFWNSKGDASYYIGMIIDADNAINEEIEDNNVSLHDEVKISNTKYVDLYGTSFNVNPDNLITGQRVTADFTVRNGQQNSSGNFDVDFYLSTNEFISTSDKLLKSYTISNISGDSSTNRSTTLQLPSGSDAFWNTEDGDGQFYIGMIVDGDNDVTETDENNNRNRGEFSDGDGVFIQQQGLVTVTINRLRGGNSDNRNPFKPSTARTDFYTRVSFDSDPYSTNNWLRSPTIGNDNDISPNWRLSKNITGITVPINVQAFDSDGFLQFEDDHLDIDPGQGKDLNLSYNLFTGIITGDVSGLRGQQIYTGDSREIWFTIDHY
ncbi:MAG: S8 family serine peptidase [Leptolyngbya sp. SIO3F4]|nr:S8 family serine peptidase [Leptolyngbya sp. SIO3F4]